MPQTQTATTGGGESFAALFEESLKRSEMRAGEVITAEVVRVEHSFVVVNAGLKSEAYVPIDEFKNDQGELRVTLTDALEQNRSVSRSVTESYVQDSRDRTLGRFVQAVFTYTFR